jgi:hypothetical protein
MSYEDRRYLMQLVFGGKDAEGKRLGVYVKKINEQWIFTINGILLDDKSPFFNFKKVHCL